MATDPIPVIYATDVTARWKIAVVVTKSIGSAVLGVLMGSNWADMSAQQQFMAVIAIVVNACVAIEALFDKTMSSRAAGKIAGATPSIFSTHTPVKPTSP